MEVIFNEKAPAAIGPYSQGYKVGDLVITSGQIPVDPESGNVVEGGIEEQTHRVCRNLSLVLQAAGCELTDVVKTTCFLKEMSDFAAFNAVYAQYFTGKPARSCVAVKQLPKDVLVEIECIAECK